MCGLGESSCAVSCAVRTHAEEIWPPALTDILLEIPDRPWDCRWSGVFERSPDISAYLIALTGRYLNHETVKRIDVLHSAIR